MEILRPSQDSWYSGIICEFCKFYAMTVDRIPFRNEMKSHLQINMIVAMCEGGGIGRGDLNCNVYTVWK